MRRQFLIVSIGALGLLGCSKSSGRDDNAAYCSKLSEQQELLIAPMETAEDIASAIGRYQAFADTAPLDVNEQWGQLAKLLDRAATVDLEDPEAKQEVINEAYAAEQAARTIADHASTTCQLDTLKLIIPPALEAPPPAG